MIWWLFGHVWWALPSALALGGTGALTFGAWPVVAAFVSNLPPRVQAVALALLCALVAASGLYAIGVGHGVERCRSAQEAAEARADAKAARVAKKATDAAKEATKRIEDRTEDAADDVQREMDSVGCDQPIPDGVRDELDAATQRAREALPSG